MTKCLHSIVFLCSRAVDSGTFHFIFQPQGVTVNMWEISGVPGDSG